MPVKTNERTTHWISARAFDGAPSSGDFIEVVDLGNGRRGALRASEEFFARFLECEKSDGITDARPPDPDAHFFGSAGVLRAFAAATNSDDPARSILHADNAHANGRLVDGSSVLVAQLGKPQSC
jgi:hypothetical protein